MIRIVMMMYRITLNRKPFLNGTLIEGKGKYLRDLRQIKTANVMSERQLVLIKDIGHRF